MKDKKLKALSNVQIDQYYKGVKKYGGCFSRDNLPKKIQNKCYIINLDSITGPGTHWLSVMNVDPDECYYFDSYGVVNAPIEIEKFMSTSGKTIGRNHVDLQAINTDSCGEFCIYMVDNMIHGRKFDDIVNDFTLNPVINEHILAHHFRLESFTDRTLKESFKKHSLDGEGIRNVYNWMKKKAISVVSTVKQGVSRVKGFIAGPREHQGPQIREFLKDHGDDEIIAMRVLLLPLSIWPMSSVWANGSVIRRI